VRRHAMGGEGEAGRPSGAHQRRRRVAIGTGEVGEAARWGPSIVPGGGSNEFKPDSNFKWIQIVLKPSKVWTIQKGPS
jgi:hypothetical protein